VTTTTMTLTEAETLIVHEALGVLIQSLTDRLGVDRARATAHLNMGREGAAAAILGSMDLTDARLDAALKARRIVTAAVIAL
jgi:hypothetical protein